MKNNKYILLTVVLFFLFTSFLYSQNRQPQPEEYLAIIRISSYCVTDSVNISKDFLQAFAENNPELKNEAETATIAIGMGGLQYVTQMSTFLNRSYLQPSAYREISQLAIDVIQIMIDTLMEKEADYDYINQLNSHILTINTVLAVFNL